MTEQNASGAKGGPLPELYEHLAAMQRLAARVRGLIDAAIAAEADGTCQNGAYVCLEVASETAEQLDRGLDSMALPEVRS